MEPQLKTEQEIISRFQELRTRLNNIQGKINELEAELTEHDLVIKTLEPLDKNRKCFRLIGGVLVERTVEEVLPAVQQHRQSLMQVIEKLGEQASTQQKELLEFQKKYKIRVKGEDDVEEEAQARAITQQGVLVSE